MFFAKATEWFCSLTNKKHNGILILHFMTERKLGGEQSSVSLTPFDAGRKGLYPRDLQKVIDANSVIPHGTNAKIEDSVLKEYIAGLNDFLVEKNFDRQRSYPAAQLERLTEHYILEGYIAGRTLKKPREFPSVFQGLTKNQFDREHSKATRNKLGYVLGMWVMGMADYGVDLSGDEIPTTESQYYSFIAGLKEVNVNNEICYKAGQKLREAKPTFIAQAIDVVRDYLKNNPSSDSTQK